MSQAAQSSFAAAPGVVIAERFTLKRQAGRGGMGFVYQADDRLTGRTVALKLMHGTASLELVRRFSREARLLSELNHPGIVAYVADGLTESGQPFLAMEWLEGEDLEQRLERQPLTLSETWKLFRRLVEVLAIAHDRGIVHRDIKPSNLFLRGGRLEDVVLLDFGLARAAEASRAITGNAAVMGTPGYMAPEQATHQRALSPRADIFSLGCVLYECLTGQVPFRAPHLAAVLAKILFSEPPPLHSVRPELPSSLQALLDVMLAKKPEQRFADARHLLQALNEWGPLPEVRSPTLPPRAATGLAAAEQQLVSVLLATPQVLWGDTITVNPEEAERDREKLELWRRQLESSGARAVLMADSSLLATFLLERGTATDQAALAAHCALSLKERWPESSVVLTTGLSLRDKSMPVGEVMDRAGDFLRRFEGAQSPAPQVMVDATTAGLLGPRFQLDKIQSGVFQLLSERLWADESRPLLGRPTPCVGREQELALMEVAFNACLEDCSSRALLITAAAGMGKSRLRHEFTRRLEHRGQPMLVLLGRADPMNVGSAYGLLGQALRQLCGVVEAEPLEVRREKLARRISRYLMPEEMTETVAFLGELCGVPFPAEGNPRLRAAREDAREMSARVARAMVAFLRAELSQGPVLLVLEDLHWSDSATVKLVEDVLGELAESPLMVLALARPEVKEQFPGLWARYLQEVVLRSLSQKAGARLVHEVLGAQVPEEVVARLVEQSAGNALFLEELIRGLAEGEGEQTPGTVLAMLQSRLQRLEPSLRRVLLAASLFGRTFWAGGVKTLHEHEEEFSSEEVGRSLRRAVELELVQAQPNSRFPAEVEYRFRHALVRDAAYGLVPDSHKVVGHHLAGAWLERAGEQDPLVLAEHYQRGQQKERAVHFFTQAGDWLLERQDLLGAQQCLEAALALAPSGPALEGIQSLQGAVTLWMEDFEQFYTVGGEVLPVPAPGSAAWSRMIGGLILSCAQSDRARTVADLAPRLLAGAPEAGNVIPYAELASSLICMTSWYGQRHEALAVLARVEAVGAAERVRDTRGWGWLCCARGFFEYFHEAQPWQSWLQAEEALRTFRQEAPVQSLAAAWSLKGLTLSALGDLPTAIEAMTEGMEEARRAGQAQAHGFLQAHLAVLLSGSAVPAHQEEARHRALSTLDKEKVNQLHIGLAHVALAKVSLAQGSLTEAQEHAVQACEALRVFGPFQLLARTVLCNTLLAQRRAAEARAEAEQTRRLLERLGGTGVASVGTWLVLAEAGVAVNDTAAAEGALRHALRCLRLRAGDVPDATVRERFLRQVPEHARVLELAHQWWGEGLEGVRA
ncbi:MAG TPA: protein kinase [Myxococcaceae bacterium]|jgi:predicted Ser/Thr protein kinase